MDPNDPTDWQSHFQQPPEDVVYLNNAGSSQIPLAVAEIGAKYLRWKTHPWERDSGEGSDTEVRQLYASLIRAESNNCIAFAPSTGFAMTLASQNILRTGGLQHRCRILVTESEEDSNVFPWQNICAHPESQATLQVVPRPMLSSQTSASHVDSSWSSAIIHQLQQEDVLGPVAIVALSCVHWCEGSLLGVEAVAAYLQTLPANRRPYFIIDGTQSIGALPFDVMALGADFVACSVHKWLLSPYGTSVMYLHPRHHQTWLPLDQHERYRLGSVEDEWVEYGSARNGITSAVDNEYYSSSFVSGARRINCGGHASPVNFAMIAASLRLITTWTVPAIQARLTTLTTCLAEHVEAAEATLGLCVVPFTQRCGHIMGIHVDEKVAKISLAELGRGLKAEGVLATLRHSRIRVSPYVHNTAGDMTRLFQTLERLITTAQVRAAKIPKRVMLLVGGSGWLGQQIVSAFRQPYSDSNSSATPVSNSNSDSDSNSNNLLSSLPVYLSDTHELHVTYLSTRPYFLPPHQCHHLDLSSPEQCEALIATLKPDIILNTAAMSSPAACQKHPTVAATINCPSPLLSAVHTHTPSALVLFTSTDLVYNGDSAPYAPTSPNDLPSLPPGNVYGATKLAGEQQICLLPHGLVFRLSNMVGGNFTFAAPKNGGMKFLSWVQQSLEARAMVSLKNDEYRSFVLSSDITTLLLNVCRLFIAGRLPPSHPCWAQRVYNAGGPYGLSRLDFARQVASAQKVALLVHTSPDTNTNTSDTNTDPAVTAVTRDVWQVVAMSSLDMARAAAEKEATSDTRPDLDTDQKQSRRLLALQATLPPQDVTMDSSLTEAHFQFSFSSIESGMASCLCKI